jgi:hypothetical protein
VEVYFSFRDEPLANANGKRQVREAIPVQVPDLTPSDVKEDHPATMNFGSDTRPRGDFSVNPRRDGIQHEGNYIR